MAANTLEEAKPLTELIYSNIKEIVKHHQYTFNNFGKMQYLLNKELETLKKE